MSSTKIVNQFQRLLQVNVKDHVESKNGYKYLSWVFAWSELKQLDPLAEFEIHDFPLMGYPDIKVPYLQTPTGFYVKVSVIALGQKHTEIYPVMDERMNPLGTKMMKWNPAKKGTKIEVDQPDPTSMEINKAHKRCLVKCIALFGLGLSIYAGEDIPVNDDLEDPEPPVSAPKGNRKGKAPEQPKNDPADQEPPHEHLAVEQPNEQKLVTPEQVFLIEQLAFDIGQLRKVDPAKIMESATGDKSVILTEYTETRANVLMDKLLKWKTQAEEKAGQK